MEHLITFCKNSDILVCYGAGRYAQTIVHFLEQKKIKISSCIISGQVKKGQKFMGKLDIYSLKNFNVENKKYGIILGLQEMFHEDIKKSIEEVFRGHQYDVYAMSEQDVENITFLIRNRKRDKIFSGEIILCDGQKNIYDNKISDIKKKYKKILVQYIDMRQIGNVLSWIYYYWHRKFSNEKTYYLFYPVVYSARPDLELIGANKYLSSKLSIENMEMISYANIEFWKYFLKQHQEMFRFKDEFYVHEWVEKFNNFAMNHDFNLKKEYISFSKKEILNAEKEMQVVNIKKPFICFSVRDELYRTKVMNYNTDIAELSSKYRNSEIQNYRLGIESLEDYSLQAARMGALVQNEIQWKNTIDYAYRHRSEFMDVYLCSACRFFVSNPSGIQAIPSLFSKPLVSINATILTTRNDFNLLISREKDLAILKKYWWKEKKRYLTFKEMLEREVDRSLHDFCSIGTFLSYERDGIIPIENTPEEISDVIIEMHERLQGKFVYSEEDEFLQKKYFSLIDRYPMKQNFPFFWRIGAKFLRENKWLLE